MSIIGIDFDGTICDTTVFKQEYVLNRSNTFIEPWQATRSQLAELVKMSDQQYDMMVSLVCSAESTTGANEVEGAVDAVKTLAKENELMLLTGRAGFLMDTALDWLDKHGIKECFTEYITSDLASTPKGELCDDYGIDILIDDDPGHLLGRDRLRGMVLRRGKIAGIENGLEFFENWDAILKAI